MIRIARIGLMLGLFFWIHTSWHVLPAWGHKGHTTQAQSAEPTPLSNQPSATSSATSDSLASTSSSQAVVNPLPRTGVSWRDALFSHMHNKIVHFPVALGLMGALLILLGYKWPHYQPAARLILILAAISAIAAYVTGRLQEGPFEGKKFEDILRLHKTIGTTTAIALWAGVVLDRIPRARRWLWLYAILLFILICITGFFGGILAHSD